MNPSLQKKFSHINKREKLYKKYYHKLEKKKRICK